MPNIITETAVKKTLYTDFNVNFDIHPIRGDLTLLVNEDAIRRSLSNIIKTNFYERRYRARFGGNLRKHLFENQVPMTLNSIKIAISNAITNFEPRVNLLDVTVSSPNSGDSNQVSVNITFSTISSSTPITLNTQLSLSKFR